MQSLWKLTKSELLQRLMDEKSNRNKVETLLNYAITALNLDPPRIDIAKQRITIARDAVHTKLKEQ